MIRGLRAIFLAFLATALAAADTPLLPAGVEVHARVHPPDHPLTVGDPFTYTVQVTCPAGATVALPEPGKSLAPLEVRDVQQSSAPEGDHQQIAVNLELAAFRTGDVAIPAFSLQYRGPDGAEATLPVAESKVTIRSVLTPDAQDIRDIREPFEREEGGGRGLWWLMAVLAVGAAGFAWWARTRSRSPAGSVAPRPQAAHERALAALEALRTTRLDDPEGLQAYYTGLSTVLREFLEARYAVRAMEATTRMIRRELERQAVPARWGERICGLLARADLVKFARQTMTAEQATADLEEARQAVLEVAPPPETAEEVKPVSAQ